MLSQNRNMRPHLFLFLLSLLPLAHSQGIIDFSLTDHVEKALKKESPAIDVSIHPPSDKQDYLIFPEACSLTASFEEKSPLELEELMLLQEEEQLSILQDKIRELLSLSEEIKRSKKLVRTIGPKTDQSSTPAPLQLDTFAFEELGRLQGQLIQVNETINAKVEALKKLILQELNRTKQNNLDEVRLKFQLAIYQARLQLLRALQRAPPESSLEDVTIPSELFGDIEEAIRRERNELKTLKVLLDGFSRRQELKIRFSNLQSQIEGIDLMIREKESCDQKKGELHNREDKKQFDKIYNQLKHLKSLETANTTYCEGVARLLQKQLKKMLRVYNYSFACSEGLSELQNSKLILETELGRLKRAADGDDYEAQFNKLKIYFENQGRLREDLMKNIEDIKLSRHQLNRQSIRQEIGETQNLIQQIQFRLAHPPSSQSSPIDYSTIREVVNQIQEKQQLYCQLKDEYLERYRGYDIAIRAVEHRAVLARQEEEENLQRLRKLRGLQERFEELRSEILKQLE